MVFLGARLRSGNVCRGLDKSQSSSLPPWQHVSPMRQVEPPTKKAATPAEDDEDNDIDLFGSDEEEEDKEAARLREERLRQYAEKKAKKPSLIAKSSILLDVKPVSGSMIGLWEARSRILQLETEGGVSCGLPIGPASYTHTWVLVEV